MSSARLVRYSLIAQNGFIEAVKMYFHHHQHETLPYLVLPVAVAHRAKLLTPIISAFLSENVEI